MDGGDRGSSRSPAAAGIRSVGISFPSWPKSRVVDSTGHRSPAKSKRPTPLLPRLPPAPPLLPAIPVPRPPPVQGSHSLASPSSRHISTSPLCRPCLCSLQQEIVVPIKAPLGLAPLSDARRPLLGGCWLAFFFCYFGLFLPLRFRMMPSKRLSQNSAIYAYMARWISRFSLRGWQGTSFDTCLNHLFYLRK